MRFKIAVLLPLLLVQLTNAQTIVEPKPGSLAYLDWRYGFRDLKFEQPVATCRGMVLVEDDGDLKFYTRKEERLELGGAKLKLIEYGFYRGKLANVTINAEGKSNSEALLKVLQKDYGTGIQAPHTFDKLYWFGQKVLVDYMSSAGGEKSSCGMWSKPMQALRGADAKVNPKKDAKGN
jgi:hypothetical protein